MHIRNAWFARSAPKAEWDGPGIPGALLLPVTCTAGTIGSKVSQQAGGETMTTANSRSTDYPVDPLFLERWSPRAFTGAPISEYDLLTILEAARWAPSSYNSQPWRFIYARRDTQHWPRLLGLLTQSNQSWAKNASALLILVSKTTLLPRGADKEEPSWTHSLDAGAAWASLALQAQRCGWAAHGMVGFDRERAVTELGVPDGYRVECAIAIGRRGDKSILPERLQAREVPSDRLLLPQLAGEGSFGAIKS
jgi:nitroreductase